MTKKDIKQLRREAHHKHRGDLYGVVVLFDIWRNEYTGERILKETHRTGILPYITALNYYSEIPNPASQLLVFRDLHEYSEVAKELIEDIQDSEWLKELFEQI